MNISFKASFLDGSDAMEEVASNYLKAMQYLILRPIAIFWDLENVRVPSGKSVLHFIQNVRSMFCRSYKEAQFVVVLDVMKENHQLIKALHDAQTTVVHVSSTSKNAADEKLKQLMRQFVDLVAGPATLLLISNDVNFATDLSTFKHSHKFKIILIYSGQISPALEMCADEKYFLSLLTHDLPDRIKKVQKTGGNEKQPREVVLYNLPLKGLEVMKKTLSLLSDNVSGKVKSIHNSTAVLKFPDADHAAKAKKRLDKEIVYGQKIKASLKTCSVSKSGVLEKKTEDIMLPIQGNKRPEMKPLNFGAATSRSKDKNTMKSNMGVELCISNLDQNYSVEKMKKTLLSLFSEHVTVLKQLTRVTLLQSHHIFLKGKV